MGQSLSLSFDQQIWRRQQRGGISRYFTDLITGLANQDAVQLLPSRRRASLVHATFYGGRPYRLRPDQALVSSLFDMTPERHPEHCRRLAGLRSPHANKQAWLAASDLLISISEASADDLQFFWPQVQTPVVVIPLATALHTLAPHPDPTLLQRRFWLLVGKRHGYKNGVTLLRALQQLGPDPNRPLLVLAGGEPLSRLEQRWIAEHKLNHQVVAYRADDRRLAWLYRNAEAVLVPSLAEGFSLPLIEALVCDTPVLASDLEVHREVAGETAVLLPALNSRRWAELLHTASRQPLERPSVRLGQERWQQQCQFYGMRRLVHDHVQTYQALAGCLN